MSQVEEMPKISTVNIRGIPFPGPPFDPDVLEDVFDFKPEPSDIFVVTYPKCGTTWTSYIVWEIVNKGIPPPKPDKMAVEEFPYLEAMGLDPVKNLSAPRLMKTHLPFHLHPYNSSTKYIYVARSPWDCVVSFYHHTKDMPGSHPDLTFDDFFDLFIEGKAIYGDYFDHVLPWYTHRNDPNILFLTYEDLKKDTRSAILKIASFIGDTYFNLLQENEEVLANCLKHTDFKYMKNFEMFLPKGNAFPKELMGLKGPELMKMMLKTADGIDGTNVDLEKYKKWALFRKGIVGDWKNHFTETQKLKFNEYMLRKLGDTEMEGFWNPLEEDAGRQE